MLQYQKHRCLQRGLSNITCRLPQRPSQNRINATKTYASTERRRHRCVLQAENKSPAHAGSIGPESKPFGRSHSLPSLRHHKSEKGTEINGASGYGSDDIEAKIRNRKPPSFVQRLLAAFFYIVPWLDIVSIGYEYHRRFPTSIIFCVIPDPFFNIYYSSQFAPLIIFFLLFLSVVKNFRLHHFTRFHCMQAIVLDIVTMLFTLVRQYFPAEIRWSPVLGIYDMFAYNVCICTIVYCIFFALIGRYANITYVSESTYMQVEEGA